MRPLWALLVVLGLGLAQVGQEGVWAARALWLWGEELLLAGRYEEAAEVFRRALGYHPGYGEAHLGRAQALLALGRSREAVPHLEAFLRLVREHPARGWVRFVLVGLGRVELELTGRR